VAGSTSARALGSRLVERLSQVNRPILIHPTNADGLPLANERSPDSVLLLAKMLHRGEADALQNCRFVATHTHGVHRALHDTIGMLYYFRKDRRLMARFILDYIEDRPSGGQDDGSKKCHQTDSRSGSSS
jgi:hypothetical protein